MKTASIIVPIYNEEEALPEIIDCLKKYKHSYEIIFVNDASTDNSLNLLKESEFKYISHSYNKGYGRSIKTGIQESTCNIIVTIDGDGQHNFNDIPRLINELEHFDMVSGVREIKTSPMLRWPGKLILAFLTNLLLPVKIPDFNCGLRAFKKEAILHVLPLCNDGFSFSTSTLFAMIHEGYKVKFIPVETNPRKGKSSLKLKDGMSTFMFILNLTMLYSPLKVFLPISLLFFISGVSLVIYETFTYKFNVSDSGLLFFIGSLLVFLFGLIAEQIAYIRREIQIAKRKHN